MKKTTTPVYPIGPEARPPGSGWRRLYRGAPGVARLFCLLTIAARPLPSPAHPPTSAPPMVERPGLQPQNLVLTWSGDPRTSQAIQWSTGKELPTGVVAFAPGGDPARLRPGQMAIVHAASSGFPAARSPHKRLGYRHTVELTGLVPGTRYVYAIGDGTGARWSDFREFITAPASPQPFSFIYLSDPQKGDAGWGAIVKAAHEARPQAAFVLVTGDLVNRGNDPGDWSTFFEQARPVFESHTLVPVIGNHECRDGEPKLYLEQLALARNGPAGIEPERAYSYVYGNALFIILDSTLDPAKQALWLERELAASTATWKIVAFHHPAYSSARGRDNSTLRRCWTPIFDKYHVDLALQGHDHAYLRTYPMKAGQRVGSPAEGTIYVVSVAGPKMYAQAARDYMAEGFAGVPTWQIVDIDPAGNRLVYRAFEVGGRVRDTFSIVKGATPTR